MGWLSGWRYRRAITITEQSGSTLTDYQVRIELNSSNFDFSKANADGSDIRFTADDGETLLSYWIEKWDNTNEEATIWVKVSSIPANGETTIYMYYGNSGAVSESDAENVFDFYDDFDDLNKWTQVRDGSSYIAVSNGLLEIHADGDNRAYARSNQQFSAPYVLEVKAKRVEDIEILVHWDGSFAGNYDNPNNGYWAPTYASWASPDYLEIGKFVSNSHTVLDSYDITLDTEFHIYTTKVKNDGIEVYLDGSKILSTTDTTFTSGYLGLSGRDIPDGIVAYYDWVRVRKYAEQEPTASVGSETSPTICGIVKLSNGTPVEGATVISIREDTFEIVDITTSESDGSYTLSAVGGVNNTVIVIPSAEDQNGDIKCHIQPT